MNDFRFRLRFLDVKVNRALHAVEVVVKTAGGFDKQWSADADQAQVVRQLAFKGILDEFDRHLGFFLVKQRAVMLRQYAVFDRHGIPHFKTVFYYTSILVITKVKDRNFSCP